MIKATKEILNSYNDLFERRKQEILNTKDSLKITGTAYYVSNSGDDNNDGKSENTPLRFYISIPTIYHNPTVLSTVILI